jgi:hypothetical protein
MTTINRFFSTKERKRYYKTIEIYDQINGTFRYVTGRIDPKNFTLESSAPRDAGLSVEYTGGYFEYSRPEQSESNVSLDIQLGRIGKQIKQKLKNIRGFDRFNSAEVILREYIEGQESEPVFVLKMYIATITLTRDGVVIRAELDNPSNINVSRIATSEDFPGLAESL